jgi:hypothetical protein
MSFVQKGTPRSQLPLIIEFEAKSIDKKFPQAKSHMETMYVYPLLLYLLSVLLRNMKFEAGLFYCLSFSYLCTDISV